MVTAAPQEQWDSCKKWHDSAIEKLNESQMVEYQKLVQFLNATRGAYRALYQQKLHANQEQERMVRNDRRHRGIFFLVLFGALAWVSFSGSDESALWVGVFGAFYFAFYLIEREGDLSRSQSRLMQCDVALRMVERDLQSAGALLETVQKLEKQQEKMLQAESEDAEQKETVRLKTYVLEYALRWEIVQLVTGNLEGMPDWYVESVYGTEVA